MKKYNVSVAPKGAFSLIELLVVVAVIAIVAGFAVPAVTTMIRGSQLTQSSQAVIDQIALARQLAVSRSRSMEVRFYKFADPEIPGETVGDKATWTYRAMQVFEVLENGAALPVGSIQRLPVNVIINPDKFSTIIRERPENRPKGSDPEMPDKNVAKNYLYVSVRFLPDGSTDLPPTGTPPGSASKGDSWYITLHAPNEKLDELPANYFTLQLDPVTGTTRPYRR